jgi:eukaryotic-like serine/threonine-protein kinase
MAEVAERFGPYTCVRRLGVGGMAETFLAVQHGTAGFEQRVCMKFMLASLRNDRTFRQMFLREATIAASLRHANIVGVIDVDEEAGYIVLELVDGVDLRTLLDAAPSRRLQPHHVSLIAVELCKALAYAHARTRRGQPFGIVHRDISPSNVLVSHYGEIKLTDFGVAKAMGSVAEPPSTGIKGKLCYMSPEQTRGENLDGRSDLFSLGIMLFELLAGVRPFDGPTDAQTLLRIESGKHPSLVELAPEVPGGLALVIERMLRRDPDHRYPSADACIDALARFAAPITTYRELGELARKARPPVTLSTGDFATPGSGSRPVPAFAETRRSLAPPPGAEIEPLGGRTLRQPRPVDPPALPTPLELSAFEEPKQPRAQLSRVSRGAWFALAGSLLAACIVMIAWIARLGGTAPLFTRAQTVTTTQPLAAAQAPETATTPAPAAAEASEAEQTSALLRPDVPRTEESASDRPSAPVEPVAPPAAHVRTPSTRPPEPAREPSKEASQATAVLRVGTVPLGQVWIDGAAAGWAPVVVNLPPGSHVVEGGNTHPEVKRSVRLKAGETTRLVLSLENDAMFSDEETDAPSR